MTQNDFHAPQEIARSAFYLKAKKILDLSAGDQDGNPVGKPKDDGIRHELNRLPNPVTPKTTSITPAMSVQTKRPFSPCWATMPILSLRSKYLYQTQEKTTAAAFLKFALQKRRRCALQRYMRMSYT